MARSFSFRFGQNLIFACAFLGLTACGGGKIKSDTQYVDKERTEMYKQGSLASDNGGIDLLGGDAAKATAAGMTVNAYLWRATLDTISFMPLASVDPFGGVILTDWYAKPGMTGERMKLNVFIMDRELRADGVKVKAFRQVNNGGSWIDAEVAPGVATALEETILTRARQMKIVSRDDRK